MSQNNKTEDRTPATDAPSTSADLSLGVDVGGTFTDLALWDGHNIKVGKVSSTTDDQSRGVINGATEITPDGQQVSLVHGTTVATNALLERRGAKTLLITNTGFEAVIEIARQNRPSLYDAFADRAEPLVSTELRFGISLTEETTEAELDEIIADITTTCKSNGVEAIAICLLYAYADPSQERRLRSKLVEQFDLPISISSEVVAEFREYERLSTTTLNAFLSPEVAKYMGNLGERAEQSGLTTDIAVMRSSGGLISLPKAAKLPSSILLSGPAGGVVAAAALGKQMGHETLVSFDMGGTSSDVCRVENGRPEVTYSREIEGYACLMPSVAVHTVGAGGGSIAWVDDGGALRVGPQSAGAFPGPACYGRGGTEPTVTDANLVLGRLDPAAQLAGSLTLRRDLAFEAFERIGDQISMSATDVAKGVLAVVESHMTHAIRTVSVEQGTDPRQATLVAFGGAGALHASSLARELNMKGVVIPPYAGVYSAFGLLLSPPRADMAWTVNLDKSSSGLLARKTEELLELAKNHVLNDSGQPAEAEAVIVDMRYVGQAHETSVPYQQDDTWESLCQRYHALHEQHNGFCRPEDDVEAVTIRAEAVGAPALSWADLPAYTPTEEPKKRPSRTIVGTTGLLPAEVWWRPALEPGTRIDGPAIIEEGETTIYIDEGEHATIHETGAIEIKW